MIDDKQYDNETFSIIVPLIIEVVTTIPSRENKIRIGFGYLNFICAK